MTIRFTPHTHSPIVIALRRMGGYGIIHVMKGTLHSIAQNAHRMFVLRLHGSLPLPSKHDGRAVGGVCAALCAILGDKDNEETTDNRCGDDCRSIYVAV